MSNTSVEERPHAAQGASDDSNATDLDKTGVEFTFTSGAFVLLLLGAGISLRKYASPYK